MGLPNTHMENLRQSCSLGQERKFTMVFHKQHVCGVPSSLSCPVLPAGSCWSPSWHPQVTLSCLLHPLGSRLQETLHPSPQIKLNWRGFYRHRCSLLKSICCSNSFFLTSMPRAGLFCMGSVLVLFVLCRGCSSARASWC